MAAITYRQAAETSLASQHQVGDKVYLVTSKIKTKQPMQKLDGKKIGPFSISEKISSHAYCPELTKTMKIHDVFHISLLAPFREDTDFHWRQIKPPLAITEKGEEEYKVKKIVSQEQINKGKKKGLYYQIQWKGYGLEEDTTECPEKFAELDNVMAQFLADNPANPVPTGYTQTTHTSIKEQGKGASMGIGLVKSTSAPTSSTISTTLTTPLTTTTTTNNNSKQWDCTATIQPCLMHPSSQPLGNQIKDVGPKLGREFGTVWQSEPLGGQSGPKPAPPAKVRDSGSITALCGNACT